MEIVGFEEVRDAVLGSLAPELGPAGSSAHRHGLKVWFAESKREHYEAQVVKVEGEAVLEIGFHAEHPKASENDAAVALLAASEARWRSRLGDDAVLGPFLGRAGSDARVRDVAPAPLRGHRRGDRDRRPARRLHRCPRARPTSSVSD